MSGREDRAEDAPVARTRHGELTLDQIGAMQPGLQRLMLEISERYWILYYAAQAGNWELARYQLNGIRKAQQIGELTRPAMAEHLRAYDRDYLEPIMAAIQARDWQGFQAAYRRGVDGANHYHRVTNHGYIHWQLPDEPPRHLRLQVE